MIKQIIFKIIFFGVFLSIAIPLLLNIKVNELSNSISEINKESFTEVNEKEKIQEIIRLELEKYQANFKSRNEGFIKKWPKKVGLYGWLISIRSGGKLKPHIHDNGWISGSIYINVPSKLAADDGNLVLSLGEEKDSIDAQINKRRMVNVATGSLVLFPASLTHWTIPFEAEEERIVLAFDVTEKAFAKRLLSQ